MPRSAEDACVEFARCVIALRDLRRWWNRKENFCEAYEPFEPAEYSNRGVEYPGYSGVSKSHCLETYDGFDPGSAEQTAFVEGDMCEICKCRLDVRDAIRSEKRRLIATKRSVEVVGKRISKERAARPKEEREA